MQWSDSFLNRLITARNEKKAMEGEKEHVKITKKNQQRGGRGGKREQIIQQTLEIHSQRETSDAWDKGKVRMRIFRFGGGSCRGNNRIHLHPCPSIPSCAASGNLTLSDRTCLSPIVVSGYLSIFSFLFFPSLFFPPFFRRFFVQHRTIERNHDWYLFPEIWNSLTSNISNME